MELPVYKAIVNTNDDTGMETISLVDYPATEVDFYYFNDDKKKINYSIDSEEQRKIFGLVMEADKMIYRNNNGYEYYIYYDRKTIEYMAEKYLRQNRQNNVDLQHSFVLENGVYLNEIFIKDSTKGINPIGFETVSDGSLFACFKIENDDIWNAIKDGTFKGFSLSGLFDVELVEKYNKKTNNIFMSKLEKIKSVLKSLLMEFNEVATSNGVLLWDSEEDLKVGDKVKKMGENGEEVDAEDGEYSTEGNLIYIIKDGEVVEIKDKNEEPIEEPTEEPIEEPKEEEMEEPTEEKVVDEPEPETEKEDLKAKIAELEDIIKTKDVEIEDLKNKVAELENQPSAKSAEEEFENLKNKEIKDTPKNKMAQRGYKFQ